MDFSTWDSCFNLLLLIFWIRIWTRDERDNLFNPYLASASRLTSSVLHFLRPAFLMLPDRIVAGIAMLLLFFLRAIIAMRPLENWELHLGFEVRQTLQGHFGSYVAFTLLSFALFVFKLWAASLLFLRDGAATSMSQTHAALYAACRPFPAIPHALRPAFLLAFGIALCLAINLLGFPSPQAPYVLPAIPAHPLPEAYSTTMLWRCLISSVSGLVGVLNTIVNGLVILIIGSWIGLLTNSQGISVACRDWSDMLLGPIRRYPLRVGVVDLSPLIFIIALYVIHALLQSLLFNQYLRLVS